jgi:hypothetical protein
MLVEREIIEQPSRRLQKPHHRRFLPQNQQDSMNHGAIITAMNERLFQRYLRIADGCPRKAHTAPRNFQSRGDRNCEADLPGESFRPTPRFRAGPEHYRMDRWASGLCL